MEILFAAILGIIQGLTEFLPVSSSAHLILTPWFFGQQPEGLAFDVAVHIGTAVAVIAFFWKDWICLVGELIASFLELFPKRSHSLKSLLFRSPPSSVPGYPVGWNNSDFKE